MRRLLVTGGAGFIGVNFVRYWMKKYPQDRVVVLDALLYCGNRASLTDLEALPEFGFVHGNICDQALVENILSRERLNTIVHFAAESHVDRSITGPDAFLNTNVTGTHSLLKAARNQWLKHPELRDTHHFHHVSTDEVYGTLGPDDPPFKETSAYAPNSPYAASKAASDHFVRAYHRTFGVRTTTSNCSNNYGAFQFPEKLIPLFVANALCGKPLPVYGDGSNIRDWLYVEDHCRGIDLILQAGRIGQTYNIGGNTERANIDVVNALCAMLDREFEQDCRLACSFPDAPAAHGQKCSSLIRAVRDRPGHDWRYALDAGKIRTELGHRPTTEFAQGLSKTIRWMLQNEPWWRPLLV